MKLPTIRRHQQPRGRPRSERNGDEGRSQVMMQAQQGVYECQEDCRQRYPRNVQEQLRCYMRDCWR